MLDIPSDRKRLVNWCLDLIERCRTSAGNRTAYYRSINTLVETGKDDGQTKSRINLMYHHLRRTASHLFSPVQLQFVIDFEREYPKQILERGQAVGRVLTRDWERHGIGREFGQGVFEGLKYGACVLKQWTEEEGENRIPAYRRKLVMPWQFAVYREDENELNMQSAMVETTYLSRPQVWQRIWKFPDAKDLMNRVGANASRGNTPDDPSNFLNHILSTNQISTLGTIGQSAAPGGVANFSGSNNFPIMGAVTDVDLVKHHEIWVKGPEDYVTIQLIEPDILIMPYFSGNIMTRKTNALIPGKVNSGLHPYTLIQANKTSGYLWGRSELYDLIEPQFMLSQTADDIRRLFGVQVDKVLALKGVDGDIDELYDSMRSAGYFNAGQQGEVKDITPAFPPESMNYLKTLFDTFNVIGGFPDIMQGKGETGVRAGSHANTLLKTGSPRLRDMSLEIEECCACAADLTLSLKEAKDGTKYWTHAETMEEIEKTSFILNDLPDDRRVTVDSHSSSPIFADDHQQLVAFGVKSGIIDNETAIDLMPLPNKELIKTRMREKQKARQQQIERLTKENPQAGEKLALKSLTGGRR